MEWVLSWFDRWENWSAERVNVAQLGNNRVQGQIQVFWYLGLSTIICLQLPSWNNSSHYQYLKNCLRKQKTIIFYISSRAGLNYPSIPCLIQAIPPSEMPLPFLSS